MRRVPLACRKRCLSVTVAAAFLLLADVALALEAWVDASSVLQLYTVRSRFGTPVLMRERLTHTLGLDMVSLLAADAEADGPKFVGHFRLRLDGDYGIRDEERDATDSQNLIAGLEVAPVDLTYGTIEIRNLFRRTTTVGLGRQVVMDELGWWSYDGAKIAFSPAGLFEISGFAGYEQRGGLPFLSTSRYESDGVFRGNREGYAPSTYPGFLDVREPAFAWGGGFSVLAVPHVRLRADYRRVEERDRVVTVPFADDNGELPTISSGRISSERAGVGGGFDVVGVGAADAALVYDGYRRRISEHSSRVEVVGRHPLSVSLGHRYVLPSFDGDSIFNWFGAQGTLLLHGEAGYRVSPDLEFDASFGVRFFGLGGGDGVVSKMVDGRDWLCGMGGVFRQGKRTTRGRMNLESGVMGRLVTADVSASEWFLDDHLEGGLLTGMSYYRDAGGARREGTNVLYVASLRWETKPYPRFGLEWEHILAQSRAQRFRVIATAEARW